MDIETAYDKIYRYVYFKVNDRAVAEDITQETFLKYLSKKNGIHDYEMKYMYTIAKNLCIDEYRRIKPEALTEEHAETIAAKSVTPALGPSLGVAPSGMWICTSFFLKNSGFRFHLAARVRISENAVRADSFITSPS